MTPRPISRPLALALIRHRCHDYILATNPPPEAHKPLRWRHGPAVAPHRVPTVETLVVTPKTGTGGPVDPTAVELLIADHVFRQADFAPLRFRPGSERRESAPHGISHANWRPA